MVFVREITAFLENKPGRLAKFCSTLAYDQVDLRAGDSSGNGPGNAPQRRPLHSR